MTTRQIVTRSALAVLLAILGLGSLGFVQQNDEEPTATNDYLTAMPVETVQAEAVSSFSKHRTFTGVIKASRTSELGFERAGRLVSVAVSEGDFVSIGQELAQLDSANLKAKQQELTAQRDAAKSLLSELEAGPRIETIEATKAEVRDLESQVELANLNFKRRERLLATKATSQEEFENASLGFQSIQAKLEAARQRLEELEAGTRSERLEAQRAVVAQLEAALANVTIDIAESTLRAPFAGMIGKRYLDEGTIAASGEPLVRIVEVGKLEAWIGLPTELSGRLQPQQHVTVEINGQRFDAEFTAVLPELDQATRTQTAIFELGSSDGVIPSQIVRLDIEATIDAQGVWVPTTALTRGSRGLWSVLVVERKASGEQFTAVRRDVEMLHTDGGRVLIRGTISPGDEVITSGTHRVVSGQIVLPKQMEAGL